MKEHDKMMSKASKGKRKIATDDGELLRFTRNFDKKWKLGSVPEGFDTPCRIWTSYTRTTADGKEIGQFWFFTRERRSRKPNGALKRTNRDAHEVAWELRHGKKIPRGVELFQSCDNGLCCAVEHVGARTLIEPEIEDQGIEVMIVVDNERADTTPDAELIEQLKQIDTDEDELRAITDGKPVTPEGAAVMTPIQTTPVRQVFDPETGQRLADQPVRRSNVTSIVQRGTPELHLIAGQMTHDNVGDTVRTVIDGQTDREGKIVEIAHTLNGVKLCLAVRDDEIVRRFRPTETVRIVERRQHDVIPGFGETP